VAYFNGLNKIMKIVSQDDRPTCQESHLEPPIYDTGMHYPVTLEITVLFSAI
jgi:hypothetical protein